MEEADFHMCTKIDHSIYFQEQLVFLFFNLTRKTD
jgi:hypothetical protein